MTDCRRLGVVLAALYLAPTVGDACRPQPRLMGSLYAQDAPPMRAHLMGDPIPGRDAPAFSLPYATAGGPGPADQPFVLRAELGRVVVLAFCPDLADNAALAFVSHITEHGRDLFSGEVVVAVVTTVSGGPQRLAERARELGVAYKLLDDGDGAVRRMFGVERGEIGAYVVSPDGRVAWRDLRFDPLVAEGYGRLREAVRRAGRW